MTTDPLGLSADIEQATARLLTAARGIEDVTAPSRLPGWTRAHVVTHLARNADGSHTVTAGTQTFTIDPEDFNVRSFLSNVVLRWEWRPGSTM